MLVEDFVAAEFRSLCRNGGLDPLILGLVFHGAVVPEHRQRCVEVAKQELEPEAFQRLISTKSTHPPGALQAIVRHLSERMLTYIYHVNTSSKQQPLLMGVILEEHGPEAAQRIARNEADPANPLVLDVRWMRARSSDPV